MNLYCCGSLSRKRSPNRVEESEKNRGVSTTRVGTRPAIYGVDELAQTGKSVMDMQGGVSLGDKDFGMEAYLNGELGRNFMGDR